MPDNRFLHVVKVRLLAHVLSLGGATFGVALVKAALAAAVARVYGAGNFGLFASAFAYCQLVAIFFDLGLGDWALFARAQSSGSRQLHRTVTRLFVLATIIFGTLGMLLRPILVTEPAARPLVLPLLLIGWAYAGQALMQAVLRARYQVGVAAKLRLVQVGANALILTYGMATRLTLPGLLWLLALAELGLATTFWIAARERIEGIEASEQKVRRSAIPSFAISTVSIYIYMTSDAFLLSIFHASDVVGQYVAASRVYLLGVQISSLLVNAALPLLYAEGKNRSTASFISAGDLQRSLTYIIGISGIAGASVVVDLIYGKGFHTAGFILSALMISLVIRGVGHVPASLLTAFGRQSQRTAMQVATALFNLGCNLYAIPRFGIWGALATTLVSDAMLICGYCLIACRIDGSPIRYRELRQYISVIAVVIVIWCATKVVWDNALVTGLLGIAGAIALRIRVVEPFWRLGQAFKQGERAALVRN